MNQPLPPPLSTPHRNLIRLTIARGITWTGFLILIIFGLEIIGFQLNVLPVISIIIAMGLVNVATWWRLGQSHPVTDTENLIHLLVDIAGLTMLFFHTGGSTNPFVPYYLVPVTMAAATLPWRYAWVIAAVGMGCYSFLMVFYEPVPQLATYELGGRISLHVIGMWLNFGLSASLVTYFIYKMAHALRTRDQALSTTREAALRSEQVLAVASQAAGTAHELGTPLSTMAVLLSEMREDAKDKGDPQLEDDLALLRSQVDTCKQRLQAMVAAADRRRMEQPQPINAAQWLEEIVQRWLVVRPDVQHSVEVTPGAEQASMLVDTTLEQALMNLLNNDAYDQTLPQALENLLNNAADACPDDIEITLEQRDQEVLIDIRDHGDGVPMAVADQLGETFISTKSKGMGIGLFLTHATINRFGGGVSLYNHEDGGTLTEVRLPLHLT